jgi:hypothetical protein
MSTIDDVIANGARISKNSFKKYVFLDYFPYFGKK